MLAAELRADSEHDDFGQLHFDCDRGRAFRDVAQVVDGAAERFTAAARILEAAHASPAAKSIDSAKTAVFDLVDDLTRRRLADQRVIDRAETAVTWLDVALAAIAEPLDVSAGELEHSPAVATGLIDTIGIPAAAAFVADLLMDLSRRGVVLTWSATVARKAAESGVIIAGKAQRDEVARRREGMRRELAQMEETKRELADLRLASDEPPELLDADRNNDDATGAR